MVSVGRNSLKALRISERTVSVSGVSASSVVITSSAGKMLRIAENAAAFALLNAPCPRALHTARRRWSKVRRRIISIGWRTGAGSVLRLPLIQKLGNGGWIHTAHRLEFTVLLAVEYPPMLIQNSEGRHSTLQRNVIFGGKIEILVVVANIHMNQHVVIVEQRQIGLLVNVDIQYLAVSAPVSAEVENNVLVRGRCRFDRLGDIGMSVGGCRVD